ncbi:MAG: response regulator [Treponema sp.]|jgi:signal transduction histidine kinase/DNA-binding response OmpR family regulator|nr:response regulator [Treponema sp.]
MKLMSFVHTYFFSETLPREGKILNLVCCFGIFAAFITAFIQFLEGASLFSVLAILSMVAITILLVYLSNKFRIYKACSRFAVIAVCDILMPLVFFSNAGINSGMPAYFVMCIVLIFLVLKGRECFIMVAVNLALIALCYHIQRLYPHFIIPFRFEMQRYIDHVQTIYIAGLFIGFVIKYQTTIYEREKAKAEAAARAKADFLANVSHEIRTPLNAILGFSELELRKDSSGETGKNLENIYNSGRVLLSIINDLLDISKIESGKFEFIPLEYNVPSFINDTVSLNIVRIGSKPIKFILRVDENIPNTLFGDELRIRQILNNLLSNAFKYTKEGSVELEIKGERNEDSVMLSFAVKDTGIGIKKEDLEKLFTDYNQVDTKSNRHIEGTGLGLSISKNLSEMMDGHISVQSEYGKGSVFSVFIPQKIVKDEPIGETTARNLEKFQFITVKRERRKRPRLQMPYARVLVVDDVETNLDVARGMLLPYGMEVDCAGSGHESIRLIREAKVRYDAVFMDHMMPGMDGIEAVHVIRNEIDSDYAKNVPIIALTANAIVGSDSFFLENGFQDFLSKPIDTAKLDVLLNIWVRNRKKEAAVNAMSPGKARSAASADNAGTAAAAASAGEETPSADFTRQIGSLDFSDGLKRFSGNKNIYAKILISFAVGLPGQLDRVRSFGNDFAGMSAETLNDYLTAVHGVKGACYGVAARPAGKKAEEIEMAVKRGDLEWVKAHNGELFEAADTLLNDLARITGLVPPNTAGAK